MLTCFSVVLKSKDCPQIRTHFTEVTAGDIITSCQRLSCSIEALATSLAPLSPYVDIQLQDMSAKAIL